MDFAYRPGDWHDFYSALATAYAALLGLFLVAISLASLLPLCAF